MDNVCNGNNKKIIYFYEINKGKQSFPRKYKHLGNAIY